METCLTQQTCLAQKNVCLAKIAYQPEHHTVTIAVSGALVISCLAKQFAKQNFRLGSFMKMGPGGSICTVPDIFKS